MLAHQEHIEMNRTTLGYACIIGGFSALFACERVVTEIGSNASNGLDSHHVGGNGSVSTIGTTTETPTSVSAIACGLDHTCAVVSGAALCWGSNSDGILGHKGKSSLIPIQVTGLESRVTAIAATEDHSCAIVNGSVKCWGNNYGGQLGNGTDEDSSVPVQVTGIEHGATAVATSNAHSTCAVVDGGIKCWGDNSYGQLGNNSKIGSYIPVQVEGLKKGVTAIAAGNSHTCALIESGVWCWGYNSSGQLGNNDSTRTDSSVPVTVTGLERGVTAVAAGEGHTCVIIEGGSVKCWGDNSSGQLGNGNRRNSLVPVQVTGLESGVTAIASVFSHTCALISGGIKCWGDNTSGQLGIGSIIDSPIPVNVTEISGNISLISAGFFHTCAAIDGAIQCWGDNSFGQLGNNSTTNSVSPVRVHL
jgi:alpha-tubulin suppressor-like RCC1 family protein